MRGPALSSKLRPATIVPILGTLVVLVALAFAFDAGGPTENPPETEARRILTLTTALQRACTEHVEATGRPALEWSDADKDEQRMLSRPPSGTAPFIGRSLHPDDNPYGGFVRVQTSRAATAWAEQPASHSPRDLAWRSTGHTLLMSRIPPAVARRVDELVDHTLDQDPDWLQRGRVQYIPGQSDGLLMVHLVCPSARLARVGDNVQTRLRSAERSTRVSR